MVDSTTRCMILLLAITGTSSIETRSCIYDIKDCTCNFLDYSVICYNLQNVPALGAGINVMRVETLNFHEGNITNIHGHSLPPGLKEISFSGHPLTNLPNDVFQASANTLNELRITSAAFTQLPAGLTTLANLTTLIIRHVNVEYWDNSIIKHIGATICTLILEDVGLLSSQVLEITPYLSSINLIKLDLKANKISQITDKMFENLSSLKILHLESNPITTVSDLAFKPLVSLQILVLDKTRLVEIPLALASLTKFPYFIGLDHIPSLYCPCPPPMKLNEWYTKYITTLNLNGYCPDGTDLKYYLSGSCQTKPAISQINTLTRRKRAINKSSGTKKPTTKKPTTKKPSVSDTDGDNDDTPPKEPSISDIDDTPTNKPPISDIDDTPTKKPPVSDIDDTQTQKPVDQLVTHVMVTNKPVILSPSLSTTRKSVISDTDVVTTKKTTTMPEINASTTKRMTTSRDTTTTARNISQTTARSVSLADTMSAKTQTDLRTGTLNGNADKSNFAQSLVYDFSCYCCWVVLLFTYFCHY